MGTELLILIGSIVGGTGAMLSFWAGWRARDQDPDWRRSFNHENINKPSGPPPLQFRRRNPFISDFQQKINDALGLDGYQPPGYRSINYPDPSPDRRPTNPYTGEPVTFTQGRTQRGNGSGGPSTPKPAIIPKPQPPPGRIIGPDGATIGYRPIRWRQGTNPPPREP